MFKVPYWPVKLTPEVVAVADVPMDLLLTVVTDKVSELVSASLNRTLPEPLMDAVITTSGLGLVFRPCSKAALPTPVESVLLGVPVAVSAFAVGAALTTADTTLFNALSTRSEDEPTLATVMTPSLPSLALLIVTFVVPAAICVLNHA